MAYIYFDMSHEQRLSITLTVKIYICGTCPVSCQRTRSRYLIRGEWTDPLIDKFSCLTKPGFQVVYSDISYIMLMICRNSTSSG